MLITSNIGSIEITRTFNRVAEKFHTQFMYGAREIMLNYLGLPLNNLLLGVLQHGVAPAFGLGYHVPTPRHNFSRTPVWVANDEIVQFFRNKGHKKSYAVGSVWNYMDVPNKVSNNFLPKIDNTISKGILFFPTHYGWYDFGLSSAAWGFSYQYKDFDIRTSLQSIREKFPDSDLTCCVYWSDLLSANWHSVASEFGITIVSAGAGTTNPPWVQSAARIDFLYRIRDLILSHEFVVTEGFMSSIFYALSLSKPVLVLETLYSNKPEYQSKELLWLKERFPHLFQDFTYNSRIHTLASHLLGENYRLSKEHLFSVLEFLQV